MSLTPPPPLVHGPLTRTDIVRYQGASGDFQPIHHDEPYARAAGYDKPLAIGMFSAGLLATWATDWLGPENVRAFKVRFKAQVWPDDTLTASGRVVREHEADGQALVDLELQCTTQNGDVAVAGTATFVRP